jgi:hypothetical protein
MFGRFGVALDGVRAMSRIGSDRVLSCPGLTPRRS